MNTTFPFLLPSFFSWAVLAQKFPANCGRISRYVRIDEVMYCRLESSLVHFQIIRNCQHTAKRESPFSGICPCVRKENVGECQLQNFSNNIPTSGADTRRTKEQQVHKVRPASKSPFCPRKRTEGLARLCMAEGFDEVDDWLYVITQLVCDLSDDA
ncbi:hypothetical protein DFH11DRAFT_1564577 [Phellopilus nigrolimitatus]|nr:hypothetical protein DFH11DRAFT_1564577 [Phellopilus nigrolimitatus]